MAGHWEVHGGYIGLNTLRSQSRAEYVTWERLRHTGWHSRPSERIGTAPGAQVVYGSQITRFQPQTGIVHTCARLFTADLHTSHIWQYMCL